MAKRSGLEQVRRTLYKTQRLIGDGQAARRGAVPLARRLIRRRLTRDLFRLLR